MDVQKKRLIQSMLALGLVTLLNACGGDSASISEQPDPELVNYTNGCSDYDQRCQNFVVDYPIAGLDFECQKDTVNHFMTEIDKNVAIGGCRRGDTVKFAIQTPAAQAKILLGNVDLSKINPNYVSGQPTQIGLMHIAAAMTGKDLVNSNQTDDTFRVMVALVRMFQALGIDQDANQIGDVQPITLDSAVKKKLSELTASVGVNDFLDGSYVTKLRPWVDVEQIDEAQAEAVALQLMNLAKVNVYSATMVPYKFGTVDIGGFFGTGGGGKDALANLYLINTRDGHTLGYTVQWTGVPKLPDQKIDVTFKRLWLISQYAPEKLTAAAQLDWVHPFSNKITQALRFTQPNKPADYLRLYQGQFVNSNTVPGNAFVYKRSTGDTNPPQDPKVYGAWDQSFNGERFSGQLDIFKTNPATFLDRRVFKSEAKVKSGEEYIFPLYANLIFSFDGDKTRQPIKVGIVIDENGDIRSNRTADSLSSQQCPNIDLQTYRDDYGVQQYRIGTTGAANYDKTDKSLTLRVILSDPSFAPLDGALLGLNETFVLAGEGTQAVGFTSGGIRINLQNLLVNSNVNRGITIRGWGKYGPIDATWGNMYATMQKVYNDSNPNQTTNEQKELVKNMGGSLDIELAPCYTIKKKR